MTVTYRRWYGTPEHQGTFGTIIKYWPFGFEDSRQGEVYEERVYASGVGGAMLRRTLKEFDQTLNTVAPSIPQLDNTNKTAYRNPRLVKEVSLMLDTGGDALAKTVTYEYDPDLSNQLTTGRDQIAKEETYFSSIVQATAQTGDITTITPGPRASRSETTYLNDSAYRNRNILGLPTMVVLKNANLQIVSKTESFYDEAAYAPPPHTAISVHPTGSTRGTAARANVTSVRRYFDIGRIVSGDACAIRPMREPDQHWNERGVQSQNAYSSDFKHAYVTSTTSAVPDPSGAHGSSLAFTTSSVFEFNTGLLLSSTDINGQTTTYSYTDDFAVTDPLKRVRKVTRPDGGWTKTDYGDVLGDLFALTQTKQDDTHTSKTYQYLDPLARASRTFHQ